MNILEYDKERELRLIRKEEYEIGREAGIAEARAQIKAEAKVIGKVEMFVILVRKQQAKGKSPQEISELLGLELNLVLKIIELIARNAGLSDSEITEKFLEAHPEILCQGL